MKFKNGTSLPAPDGETLTRDYEQARNLGQMRLGQLGLYFPRLTQTVFLPLAALAHVYLRLEDLPVGMGCRRVPVGQYFLMAVLRNGGSYKAALTTGPWSSFIPLCRSFGPAGSPAGIDGHFPFFWVSRVPLVQTE